MRTLFLFRHGETDWNAQDLFQGQQDIPLNDRGRAQARLLQQAFRRRAPEKIISSDLKRAHETARIASEKSKIPITLDTRLREAFVGEAEGLSTHKILSRFGEDHLKKWRSSDPVHRSVSFPGGETGHEVLARADSILQEWIARNDWQSIAFSTHGGIIRRIAQAHLGFLGDAPNLYIPNGVLYEIRVDSRGKMTIEHFFSWE